MSKINDIIKEHERRIFALEKLIGKNKNSKIKAGKQSLSDYIIQLRESNFFSQQKTAEETHIKLEGKYPCELDRVAMALLRLANRKELRKATKIVNDKKYKAYVW